MSTWLVVVLVALAAVVLFALVWWSSGRTKNRAAGPNPDGDVKHASGYLYHQNRTGDPTGGAGGGPSSF